MTNEQLNLLTFGDKAIAKMYVALGGNLEDLSCSKVMKENDKGELEELLFSENEYNKTQGRVGKNVLDLDDKSSLNAQNIAKAEIFATVFARQMSK